ncbi:hypothetical protein ENB89_11890 [Salmonella enterica subsp. enterica serovar Idikan]|nr:hypothetical protein [Salmonella enterica subsp. enterica serovar Idikan]EBL6683995.1 hypothetical protein [Salmonella enterica]ECF7160990.1 hypothetical protein [Salmonella enterica subsp. enterica]ECA1369573.1 hypothetical protein [Salmonella enterica subsp. enterica serovar Idikan]ECA6349448.1 hypothetical protein [Salmonella enterica subsp. enterica serovar Idikan]
MKFFHFIHYDIVFFFIITHFSYYISVYNTIIIIFKKKKIKIFFEFKSYWFIPQTNRCKHE